MEKNTYEKVAITTLGCDKNRCDSEQLAGHLKEQGFTFVAADKDADIIIVNTCAFINAARKEAVKVITSKLKHKSHAKIIVTGCITAKHKDLIPEGVEVWEMQDFGNARKLLSTPQSYVYIKIADGCNNWCSYCTIPAIRGVYRSRSVADILAEVRHFASLGVPEFILVAQDLTKYRVGDTDLVCLIREISKVCGVQRIRLHYVYPNGITDELVREIAGNAKICKYIDIPFQHVSERIVTLMNRKGNSGEYINLVNMLRNRVPDITIRSTFMVGFPTETDAEFDELCSFIKEAKLDCVGFFAYSREPETKAFSMPQVNPKTKNFRLKAIQSLQNDILIENHRKKIGKVVKVACDFADTVLGYSIVRTEGQSPEVDPHVIVPNTVLEVGKFYDVKIIDTDEENLIGEIII